MEKFSSWKSLINTHIGEMVDAIFKYETQRYIVDKDSHKIA